jgi:Lrp/AsnC family transcriptional regulator, regulator for asnA, asnC and gidA
VVVDKSSLLDDLDKAIIGYLYQDGRASFTEIAKVLGVSHATIRNRYLRLVELISLKITTVIDPYTVGFQAGAVGKCTVKLPQFQDVIDHICAFQEVTWVVETTSKTNLFFAVWCKDFYHFNEFFTNKISKVDGIEELETGLYSRIYRSFPTNYSVFPEARNAGARIGISGVEEDIELPENTHADSEGAHPLNDVDIQIMKQLAKDGRKPFTDIAKEIGVSQSTIFLRYKHLIEKNILRVVCWLPLSELGFSITAHFDLSISPHKLVQATRKVLDNDESTWVFHQYGKFNLGIDVYCRDKTHLDSFISEYINPLEGLRNMELMLLTKTYKSTTAHPNLDLLENDIR